MSSSPASRSLHMLDHILDQARLSGFLSVKNWDGCWDVLSDVLDTLRRDRALGDQLMADLSHKQGIAKIHEFASLLGKVFITLILNDESTISPKAFERMIYNHSVIHDILYIIGLENTDIQLGEFLSKKKKLSGDDQRKLCLLLSLNTQEDIVKTLKKVAPVNRAAALVVYLGNFKNIFPQHEKNKIKLFALRQDIQKLDINSNLISALVHAYFNISYIDYHDKHAVKQNINQLIKKYLKANKKELDKRKDKNEVMSVQVSKDRKKPVLLLSIESFSSDHAMFRSWSFLLNSLKPYFEVHLALLRGCGDDQMKSQYENIFEFDAFDMGALFLYADALKPDVLLMPSVGMMMNNILLSNMRLAPLQLMTLGHPATAMSDKIDFVIGHSHLYEESAFPEDFYIVDRTAYEFSPHPYFKDFKIERPVDVAPKKVLEVGVFGGLPKMSKGFYDLLVEIYENADFDICFTFLLNKRGIELIAAKICILKTFPDAQVYGYQPYDKYFEKVKSADIVLNQFPFGNTNTLVDVLIAGKPGLSLKGAEPHSRTESSILEAVGLDQDFLTHSKSDYKKRFFELAGEILKGKRNFFDPQKVYDKLFAKNEGVGFGAFVHWVYENQERLKASEDKLIMPDEKEIEMQAAKVKS